MGQSHLPQGCTNTCFHVWLQQRLMVRNGNIWETGTVLMENRQALKKKKGFFVDEHSQKCWTLFWSCVAFCDLALKTVMKKIFWLCYFLGQNKPLQNVLKKSLWVPTKPVLVVTAFNVLEKGKAKRDLRRVSNTKFKGHRSSMHP